MVFALLSSPELEPFKHIKIEQVYVVEPWEGKPLAIPSRFVETYEVSIVHLSTHSISQRIRIYMPSL